jgi:hypothetical protein
MTPHAKYDQADAFRVTCSCDDPAFSRAVLGATPLRRASPFGGVAFRRDMVLNWLCTGMRNRHARHRINAAVQCFILASIPVQVWCAL